MRAEESSDFDIETPDARHSPEGAPVDPADVLVSGTMTIHGRIPGSSNATLLVTCTLGDDELLGVYKPGRGERPLRDFPDGLYQREVAAYELSEALGWGLVPLTVLRSSAPHGPGSVQRFVPEEGTEHYFTLRDEQRWWPALRRLAAFDVVANNADRKSGHVLLAEDRLWAIDNGLCFHEEPKLRTVIWDFASEALDADVVADLRRLLEEGIHAAVADLLDADEQDALLWRAESLVERGELPIPRDDGRWPPYPWPLV
jgi:uncharacterized repeat protein (TIGR03843 family)